MVHLRALGESMIEVGRARVGPGAPHVFAALLYLSLESGRRVPRALLQELLFPTANDRAAAHSLRQLLYRIRRVGGALDCDAASVFLARHQVTSDIEQFLSTRQRGSAELARVSAGILPGFAPEFSPPFAEWLEQRRGELLSRIRRTLTAELVEHRRAASWAVAEQLARALLALDPLNEEATLALAEATALDGSKAEAVQLLDSYLEEVGPRDRTLRVPAAVLRRRIAERLPESSSPIAARFVGRTDELAVLRELLDRARKGDGSACHVWGEAGIGKSRLVSEFARAAILDGVRVEQVGSQPHDVRRPMGAFSDLVPALLRLPGALGCSPEAVGFLSKLFRYEGGPPAALSPDVREAELLSANITHAISELLDAVAAESPVLVILDDAQWLDAISMRVLADLAGERKQRPLLLVSTSREAELGVRHGDRLTLLHLAPLSPDDARLLFEEVLHRAATEPDDELLRWALGVAAGNPLFLQSLAAHYAATRDRHSIPAPLSALLGERLGMLDRGARRVFEACAVLARHSTLERLRRLLGLPTFELLDGLQTLEEHGFIKSEAGRIASGHALLADIALDRAAPSVRTLLHRDAARLLREDAIDESSAPLLWDCAEHWLQAGDKPEALAALRACARHALELGRPGDACDLLLRATELAASVNDRMATLQELARAADIAQRWPIVIECVQIYSQLAAQEGTPLSKYNEYVLLELEARLASGDDPGLLVPVFRNYLHDRDAPDGVRLRAAASIMRTAEDLMAPGLAAEAFDAVSGIEWTGELRLQRLMLEVMYRITLGRHDDAVACAQRAATDGRHNAAETCRALWLTGFALLRGGRFDEGCAALEASFKKAQATGLGSNQFQAAVALACLLRDLERTADAKVWHSRALALAERVGRDRASLHHFANCVLFAIDDGRFDEAEEWLRQAGTLPAGRTGYPGLIFRALQIRVKQFAHSYECSDDEVRTLLQDHLRVRSVGHHDEVMVTLWHALARRNEEDRADELLHEYLTAFRRVRWPLSPELRALSSRLQPRVR